MARQNQFGVWVQESIPICTTSHFVEPFVSVDRLQANFPNCDGCGAPVTRDNFHRCEYCGRSRGL